MFPYIKDPDEIYRQSFATIAAAMDCAALPSYLRPVAVRIAHACGMTDIVPDLRWSRTDVVATIRQALKQGAPIIADAKMAMAGIQRGYLPADNTILCSIDDAAVALLARDQQTTRSAAAMDYFDEKLRGAVLVIGNAPTCLFRLLELIQEGVCKPAAILAFPVGFVGAAESKQALCDHAGDIPYLTLLGRRGGSAMAAAALNAMLRENEDA